MEQISLLALGDGLIVEQIIEEAHQFVVLVRSTIPASCCPLCGGSSDFIHSQYRRRLADVPCTGLDDFAFRRGRTYGTLIVNLETHTLIDVLPDRTVATVSAWLAAHPESNSLAVIAPLITPLRQRLELPKPRRFVTDGIF